MSDANEPTSNDLATTLSELRALLEQTQAHTRVAADRFNDLNTTVEVLKRSQTDNALDIALLRKRLDEIRPQRLTCPHCGRAVQADWPTCRVCLKPLETR